MHFGDNSRAGFDDGCGWRRLRQQDRHPRAFADAAFDFHAAAVALNDVLDNGKPKPGAAHGARPLRIDPVKALGEARQMFGGDAVADIADRNPHCRRLVRCRRCRRHRDGNFRPGAAVFERIRDQVVEHLQHLIAVGYDHRQVRRFANDQPPLVGVEPHCQRLANFADNPAQLEERRWPDMLVNLDPRQRQQIIDQSRHALRLALDDIEKSPPRGFVAGGRTLQRLDKPRQCRQRRAQFVAGVGDEIDPHAFSRTGLADVVEHDQYALAIADRPHDPRATGITQPDHFALDAAARHRRIGQRIEDQRVAQRQPQVAAGNPLPEHLARPGVGGNRGKAFDDQRRIDERFDADDIARWQRRQRCRLFGRHRRRPHAMPDEKPDEQRSKRQHRHCDTRLDHRTNPRSAGISAS